MKTREIRDKHKIINKAIKTVHNYMGSDVFSPNYFDYLVQKEFERVMLHREMRKLQEREQEDINSN